MVSALGGAIDARREVAPIASGTVDPGGQIQAVERLNRIGCRL
jgi:hypothetical protein